MYGKGWLMMKWASNLTNKPCIRGYNKEVNFQNKQLIRDKYVKNTNKIL